MRLDRAERDQQLSGGALNAALANELGKLMLEDSATNAERNLVAAGKADLVRRQRDALQFAMAPQLVAAVERLTGRTVRSFLSGTDAEEASSIEAFALAPETSAGSSVR